MKQMTKKNAILIFVSGVLFLTVAVFAWIKTVTFRGEGVHADAVIVGIETDYFGDDELVGERGRADGLDGFDLEPRARELFRKLRGGDVVNLYKIIQPTQRESHLLQPLSFETKSFSAIRARTSGNPRPPNTRRS